MCTIRESEPVIQAESEARRCFTRQHRLERLNVVYQYTLEKSEVDRAEYISLLDQADGEIPCPRTSIQASYPGAFLMKVVVLASGTVTCSTPWVLKAVTAIPLVLLSTSSFMRAAGAPVDPYVGVPDRRANDLPR